MINDDDPFSGMEICAWCDDLDFVGKYRMKNPSKDTKKAVPRFDLRVLHQSRGSSLRAMGGPGDKNCSGKGV